MQKIAIYGGAFNPPTLGHKFIINEVFKNTDIEKIIIVPDGYRLDKDFKINELDRNNMIHLFIDDLKNKGLNIELEDYFLEGKNNSDTTTYKVDKYFKNKIGEQPYHIFGTDISGQIKDWSGNPDKYIQKKLKKIFIPRKGYDFISSDLGNFELLNIDKLSNVSSTEVRINIKNNSKIDKLVIPEIKKYIEKNNLYK